MWFDFKRKDGAMMSHTPYGYAIKNGKAALDKVKSKQVKVLFREYVAGSSLQDSGTKAGIERAHASLGRILDAPCYKGNDFYPAIVSEDIWIKAQNERKRRSYRLGRDKNYFAKDKDNISPFWNKVFCAECGQLYKRYSIRKKERWRCSQRTVGDKRCCNRQLLYEHDFEEAFIHMLRRLNIEEIAIKPPKEPMDIKQKYDNPFKQAEYVYSLTPIDDFEYQTEKLLDILTEIPDEFDGAFMGKIINRIEVSAKGEIDFILINKKSFREEVGYGNVKSI